MTDESKVELDEREGRVGVTPPTRWRPSRHDQKPDELSLPQDAKFPNDSPHHV